MSKDSYCVQTYLCKNFFETSVIFFILGLLEYLRSTGKSRFNLKYLYIFVILLLFHFNTNESYICCTFLNLIELKRELKIFFCFSKETSLTLSSSKMMLLWVSINTCDASSKSVSCCEWNRYLLIFTSP